ncbi:MAG: hypothetical protein WAO83_10990 [Fuerstiella sp.]
MSCVVISRVPKIRAKRCPASPPDLLHIVADFTEIPQSIGQLNVYSRNAAAAATLNRKVAIMLRRDEPRLSNVSEYLVRGDNRL